MDFGRRRIILRSEQLSVQSPLIEARSEGPAGVHRGCRADRLPLTWSLDDWGLALQPPGLAMHGIRPKARLTPESTAFARPGDGRKGLSPLPLHRLRVALVGLLQRLLWGQAQFSEQFFDRCF